MPNPKKVIPITPKETPPNTFPKIKQAQKTITPKIIPKTKPIQKKVEYKHINKESLSDLISKTIPKQLIPTKRIGTIFGIIFLAVVVLAIMQFPFGSLMSGNGNIVITVGYPWHFLELNPSSDSPAKPKALILDLLLYLLLAYVIDVLINLLLSAPSLELEERKKKRPLVFKDRKKTIAEKLTDKIITKQPKK